ncbi:MAG TPA: hypothetical protein V6D07_05895 [Trichocoleus sp.]
MPQLLGGLWSTLSIHSRQKKGKTKVRSHRYEYPTSAPVNAV